MSDLDKKTMQFLAEGDASRLLIVSLIVDHARQSANPVDACNQMFDRLPHLAQLWADKRKLPEGLDRYYRDALLSNSESLRDIVLAALAKPNC